MSHFADYMDGVPVKISEKYKRPPKIELPYSVSECPMRAQNVVDCVKYCSTFEKNVLSKVKELRSAKETKKNERRHRIQLLEEAKQNKLDAIAAAEAEEKLKQLSVSEVSYPSTDEISALSPDDKTDKNCDTTSNINNSIETAEATTADINYSMCSPASNTDPNILLPIPAQSTYQQSNLLDDPDPLQELRMAAKINRIQYNRNVDTLTFRDFENDTSSPFDNVELKTINDMELLAQVLQSQKGSTTSCTPIQSFVPDQGYTIPNCASQAQSEGMPYLPNMYMEQSVHGPGLVYSSPQPYPVSNGYYLATDNENVNMYIPNYQYYTPSNPYQAVDPTYYSNQMPTTSSEVTHVPNGTTYIPQPYFFQYPPIPVPYQPTAYHTPVQVENVDNQNVSTSQHTMKSRSRSVPDIMKELNEELVSAKLRANERSCNVSPAPKSVPRSSSSSEKKQERRRKKSEHLPNPFDKLPSKLQDMCSKINGMGFPLDRVARVCTLVGDNDKKVIEGLLIMGELMDLGFSEGRVSAALAKHGFNRDKALDELVS